MEALKEDLGLRNDFHGAIGGAGEYVHPDTGEVLGHLEDYLR